MRIFEPLRGTGRRLTAFKPTVLVNSCLALALAGIGTWAYFFFTEPSAQAADTSVRTVPVMQGTVTATVSADGTVESASTANADFETSGTVTEIRVKVGQLVKKGQVLAKVDATSAKRDLTYAEANLTAAREALERAEDAGSDTDDAQAQVTEAEQAVEEAEDAVDGTVLKAPMAGTVVAVSGTIGGSSGGGSSGDSSGGSTGGGSSGGDQSSSSSDGSGAFIELADLAKMQVTASFSEVDATDLKAGQAASITWNALPDTTVGGKVMAIDPNPTSSGSAVSYPATLSLERVPDGVKLGQTVSVSVTTGSVENAIYVNSAAITTTANRRTVTVVDANGQQTRKAVEIGLEGDSVTVITSGLTVGELVVITMTDSSSSSSGTNRMPGGFTGGGLTGGGLTGGRGPEGGPPAAGGGR